MRKTLQYVGTIFKHKWYVALAGVALGVPLRRLVLHDMSKFARAEMPAYRDRIANGGQIQDRRAWAYAWLNHQNRNPHHWEFWTFYWQDQGGGPGFYNGIVENGCLPMPETYVREMVADWMGASRLYTGSWNIQDWLERNLPRMKLHPETRTLVGMILREVGQMKPRRWFFAE